jgi:hypothetical protein
MFAIVGLLYGLVGAALSAQPGQEVPAAPVFTPFEMTAARSTYTLPEQVGTLRTRLAQLDAVALESGLRNGALSLNLFDDVTLSARLALADYSTRSAGHNRVWTGVVDGVRYGQTVAVSASDGSLDLRVLVPGRVYYVQTVSAGVVRISEIEAGRGRYGADGLPFDDAVIYTPSEAELADSAAYQRSVGTQADDGTTIDLLAAYTPAATAMLGGDQNAALAIEGAVTLTNLTYANSGINFRIRLVGIVRTEYVEQGLGDLSRLQGTSDGFMDELHTLRNTLAADLVSLTPGTPVEDRNYCGIAFQPGVLSATSGFSITEAHCINDITMAHELGHNMGKAHDRSNASGAIHPYAYGYQDPSTGAGDYGDFVTVMAYSTNPNGTRCPASYQPSICPAIAWWSDPDATFSGKTLGVINSEDNVRSLNEAAATVANYRVSSDGGVGQPTALPTLTPLPMPTLAPPQSENLLLNGGFEIDADSNGTADGWAFKKAVRWCNTATVTTNALTGNCSVRLATGGRITQNITPTGLMAGDMLELAYEARGNKVPANTRIRVIVSYIEPTAGANADGQDVWTIPLPTGKFTLPVGVQAMMTLTGTAQTISLRVIYPNQLGNLRLDSMALTVQP